jgi:hypothetical protein
VHEEVQKQKTKTEVEEQVTADLASNIYSMSVSVKTTSTAQQNPVPAKTLRSFDSRERDYTYDDAIEDYKTRVSQATKLDLPKVDIHKRRELFEQQQQQQQQQQQNEQNNMSTSAAAAKLGTEIVSIKDRISSLRNNLVSSASATANGPPKKKVDVPVSTKLKDRVSSLHQQAVEEPDMSKHRALADTPFKNVQEARNEFESKSQNTLKVATNDDNESLGSTDREDSGIHTTDVSCSVSQADDQQPQTDRIEEFQRVITNLNEIKAQQQQQQPDVVKDTNVLVTAAAAVVNKQDVEAEEDDGEEESVSCCSDDEQMQSIMVKVSDNTNTNNIVKKSTSDDDTINNFESIKTSNVAMINFINCNLLEDEVDDGQTDESFSYEFIINQSEIDNQMKNNGLEKSNSVDGALSVCSSSDGVSLMDESDEKVHH